ncbi:MAG: 16S rRNA (adenine(1518)-N(6)/adenine(1519)-N(6))-dimethyltransferase RsmA [bacterium]
MGKGTARGIRPVKRWGQHFLKDRSVARRIVKSLNIRSGECILEIGSGRGVLTEFLLESPAEKIIGVEIDRRLTPGLKVRFGEDGRFELIEGDFLQLDLNAMFEKEKRVRVVGNLPYSVTSPILFMLLDHRSMIDDATVTVQKEVGERILSLPGSKTYGIPSVLFQLHSRVERLFPISRRAFIPVPEVESLVIRIGFLERPLFNVVDADFFCGFIKTIFGQRRKMLRNTLKHVVHEEADLGKVTFDLRRRPEELSVEELVRLSNEMVSL